MLASSLERALTCRLAEAYDCWGQRRAARCGSRHGIWYVDPIGWDAPASRVPAVDRDPGREAALARMTASGQFTGIELRTLRALVIERMTIAEIAKRDGCTPQGSPGHDHGAMHDQVCGRCVDGRPRSHSARGYSSAGVSRTTGNAPRTSR